MYKLRTSRASGVKSIGISASTGTAEEPRVVRFTAVAAGPGVAKVVTTSSISSSPAPGPEDRAPERAASLSSPSPRIALISGASKTLDLKSTRFSDIDPARTEYTTSEE